VKSETRKPFTGRGDFLIIFASSVNIFENQNILDEVTTSLQHNLI
jgi:hypothetical protein